MLKAYLKIFALAILFSLVDQQEVFSQSTSNQSAVTNSAAPSASSVTTGGTNINYQTNNATITSWDLSRYFCRTQPCIGGMEAKPGSMHLTQFKKVAIGRETFHSIWEFFILLAFSFGRLQSIGENHCVIEKSHHSSP